MDKLALAFQAGFESEASRLSDEIMKNAGVGSWLKSTGKAAKGAADDAYTNIWGTNALNPKAGATRKYIDDLLNTPTGKRLTSSYKYTNEFIPGVKPAIAATATAPFTTVPSIGAAAGAGEGIKHLAKNPELADTVNRVALSLA